MKKLAALLFITFLSIMCMGEASADETVSRLAGNSRYETAAMISKKGWKDGADIVVLARGDSYPDALSGVPLAKDQDAPLLLTSPDELHYFAKKEIKRLNPSMVILLGGEQAIGTSIKKEIEKMGISTKRISGSDRYSTSVKIAEFLGSSKEKAVIVTGRDFPDALSAAPFAAEKGYPILLTDPKALPAEVEEHVAEYKSTLLVGGTDAISKEVEDTLPNPERISGKDRYQTSANIIKNKYEENSHLYISTGEDFADALTGSVLAAKNKTAVMLVKTESVPDHADSLLESQKVNSLTVFGGTGAVGDSVARKLNYLINNEQSTFTSYFPSQQRVSIFEREESSLKYDMIDYKSVEDGSYYLWFLWSGLDEPDSISYFEDETGLYVESNVTGKKHLMVEYPAVEGAKRNIDFLYATLAEDRRSQTIEVMDVTSDTFTYKVTERGYSQTYTVKHGKGIVDSDYVELTFPLTVEEALKIIEIMVDGEKAPVHYPEKDTEDYYYIGADYGRDGWVYLKVNKHTGQYQYGGE
ncbi:cell wall-binding repeat-containing protein [Rossellomorea aquimaris]|uniref:N-acetylmuramoyl-L-alanine amidase n=1 Tax=Rossellomorea aquimaris TaxID=189382 RepID=A0A5D4TRJ0_9BACI|nr:cell wall-binding repeat-containing protein [Rossellomorea aquimaris]TYS78533.1 hypothetical protein FZC80_12380 [Rossellomorea aquimaris]